MSPIDIYRKESIQDTLSDSLTLEDGTSATYLDTDAAGKYNGRSDGQSTKDQRCQRLSALLQTDTKLYYSNDAPACHRSWNHMNDNEEISIFADNVELADKKQHNGIPDFRP